jgi:hypothetical protein
MSDSRTEIVGALHGGRVKDFSFYFSASIFLTGAGKHQAGDLGPAPSSIGFLVK